MSAKGIFIGRIASLNYQEINTRNNGVTPKLTIQIITDDSYKDKSGTWVEKSSSFFLTDWGPRAQKINQNGTLEVGFGLYAEVKMTTNVVVKNGQTNYYTDLSLQDFEITSRPKAWHDRRNNSMANAPQQLAQPPQQGYLAINPNDQPQDDDIPF